MPDLTPMTRQEKFLNGDTDLEPITRREYFYAGRESELPEGHQEPETREEWFIKEYRGGGGGDITVESLSVTSNGTYTAPSGKAYSPVEVNVPLPENTYLKKTATTSMSDAVRLPVASAVVSVTDKDKTELFLTTDGVVSEDNTPYTYRQSPSGKSCVDLSVVGGTVAWNQLVQNGDFATTSRWEYSSGTFSVADNIGTFTAQSQGQQVTQVIPYMLNHKYLGIMQIKTTTATESVWLRFYGQNKVHTTATTNWQTVATIVNSIVDLSNSFGVRDDRTSSWDAIQIKNANLYDLTQMFGSTIADAIYTMEQATAGSGIAWLKSHGFLTKDYYANNSGSLESVNVSVRKVIGFNQWDEEWESGKYSLDNGSKIVDASTIRSKNYINVKPNTVIYNKMSSLSSSGAIAFWYDKDKTFIRWEYCGNKSLTVPSNAYYMTFYCGSSYGTTYNNDICINISDASKNGTYEPYIKHTYPLDSDLTLRGIPKLDANNNLYYDGDIYKSDGSVTRKYGYVDLGSLTWTAQDISNNRTGFYTTYTNLPAEPKRVPSQVIDAITPILNRQTFNAALSWGSNAYLFNSGAGIFPTNTLVFIFDTGKYIDATTFKTAMNGVYLVYELATPTTETADAFENPQLVGSTEEFVDAGTSASTPTRDVDIPVGQDSKYVNGNIYIKYLDSVTTGDIELADENAIIPLENNTYISSNGSASIDYWSKEV